MTAVVQTADANTEALIDAFNETEQLRLEATRVVEQTHDEHQRTRQAFATALLAAQGDMTDEIVKNAARAIMETGQRLRLARAAEQSFGRAHQIVAGSIKRHGALKGN